jgi:hypothetical protein
MNPIVPKLINPQWQQFWDKVKDDPDYFDDFDISDIEEDMIPNVDSDSEFEAPNKPTEIEEDIKVEEL